MTGREACSPRTPSSRNTAETYPDSAANFKTGSDYNLIGIWQRTSALGTHSLAGTLTAPLDPGISDSTLRSGGRWGYYLLPGSPALDAGDNAAAVAPGGAALLTDLYGLPRISGAVVDIGAIEGPAAVTSGITYHVQSLDNAVTVDGTLSLGEARQAANTNQAAGDAVAGSFAERDVIQFAPGVTGIAHLAGTPMFLSGRLAMVGPGSSLLTIDADGLSQVAEILPGADVELSDLTLTGGIDDVGPLAPRSPYPKGGAIVNYGDLRLFRDTISSNTSIGAGGGVYNVGVLDVDDSVFADNAAGYGGAISNRGTLTVTGSTFAGNAANANGGAIATDGGTITDSSFSGNTAIYGGGIVHDTESLELRNSTLTGNVAYEGAGLYIGSSNATTTVVGTTFRDNHARRSDFPSSGGGIQLEAGTLKVIQSDFLGNSADNGGGFYNGYRHGFADVFITQSRFVGNTATADGGGLYLGYYTDADIRDSTIAGNVAASGGGFDLAGDLTIYNSIVAKNTAADAYDDVASFYWRTSWNNLFGVGYDDTGTLHGQNGHIVGTPTVPVDPQFRRNPDDGRDGWGDDPATSGVDESANDDYGDLALMLTSPAIDAGDQTRLPTDEFDLDADGNTAERLPIDFGGDPRVQHGQVDMGLYETLIPTLALTINVASIPENAGSEAVVGTVSRNTSTLEELVVSLSSNDTSEATVPGAVTIPAGQTSVTFWVAVADDTLVDGTQPVTITATAAGCLSGSARVDVTDWETLGVSISPASISENGGTATGNVTRSNTDSGSPLTVNLASSDTSEAAVPATVTIPADEASATFVVTAVDDVSAGRNADSDHYRLGYWLRGWYRKSR